MGASLARRLEWRFLDFDAEIEGREGRPVRAIIEEEGEDYFRQAEAALTREIRDEGRLVVAPGGAWITNPELLQQLRPGTFAVWLRVSPPETVRRLMEDPTDRPLKDHPDPVSVVAEMLSEREPLYRLADVAINSDAEPVEKVAFAIEQLVRTIGI